MGCISALIQIAHMVQYSALHRIAYLQDECSRADRCGSGYRLITQRLPLHTPMLALPVHNFFFSSHLWRMHVVFDFSVENHFQLFRQF